MGHSIVWVMLVVAILVGTTASLTSNAASIAHLRQIVVKNNISCVLVFGDSSVDPGNNNRLQTVNKGNFLPYGKDFLGGRPTGRFTNGRLATDFIAEAVGYIKFIRAFLDPNLSKTDLLHGVSFASGASGYDDLTANLSTVISLSKQVEYLKHYKLHLRLIVGPKKAEEIINNAIFVISMGTNDFLLNYYIGSTRAQQYTIQQYQDFLVSRMSLAVKEMHRLGARRVVVVGLPPLGCMPLVKTLRGDTACDVELNQVAFSFTSKLKKILGILKTTLNLHTAFLDIYNVTGDIIGSPNLYGFKEARKGCVGTGKIEYAITCKGITTTCSEPTKYVFWDAVHFTERVYQILADVAMRTIIHDMFNIGKVW